MENKDSISDHDPTDDTPRRLQRAHSDTTPRLKQTMLYHDPLTGNWVYDGPPLQPFIYIDPIALYPTCMINYNIDYSRVWEYRVWGRPVYII